MFFAKAGYCVDQCKKGIWITAEDNIPLGIKLERGKHIKSTLLQLVFIRCCIFGSPRRSWGDKTSLWIFFQLESKYLVVYNACVYTLL